MRKFAVPALLGAMFLSQAANAAVESFNYYFDGTPEKSSFTITLSGQCSGKITLPVTYVEYGRGYEYDGSGIFRDEAGSGFGVYTGADIYVEADNEYEAPQDTATETVKKGKRTIKMTATSDVFVNLDDLDGGAFDSDIKCKDDLTLSRTLLGWNADINGGAKPLSMKGTLQHTNETEGSGPLTGEFAVKASVSGILEQPSQCTTTGEFPGGDYSVKCGQPKTINIKVAVSASGESFLD